MYLHAGGGASNDRPRQARTERDRPLRVLPALLTLHSQVRAQRAHTTDPIDSAHLDGVLMLLEELLASDGLNTISTFERVLNRCLDLGYRQQPLLAFVFSVLEPRLRARIRRRLLGVGGKPTTEDMADLVGSATESILKLLSRARRDQHTVRYALLVSIADHRTIDHLRRANYDVRQPFDEEAVEISAENIGWHGSFAGCDPEQSLRRRERHFLAIRIQGAVFEATNRLNALERSALLMVEVEGASYPDVAAKLDVKPNDVGNLVRRARKKRERLLAPLLRQIPELEGRTSCGRQRADKALRLHMLRWSEEIGYGTCSSCLSERRRLHPAEHACAAHA